MSEPELTFVRFIGNDGTPVVVESNEIRALYQVEHVTYLLMDEDEEGAMKLKGSVDENLAIIEAYRKQERERVGHAANVTQFAQLAMTVGLATLVIVFWMGLLRYVL